VISAAPILDSYWREKCEMIINGMQQAAAAAKKKRCKAERIEN
jgi:hypothetical protein